jgi:hypothetical protein
MSECIFWISQNVEQSAECKHDGAFLFLSFALRLYTQARLRLSQSRSFPTHNIRFHFLIPFSSSA